MKFFPQKRTKFNPFFLTHLCVYFSLMAAFYNSLIGVISKLLSSEMSSFEIVFFRNFFGLIIVIWVLFKQKDCNFFSGGHLGFLIFRGVIGLCGMSAFFIISQIPILEPLFRFIKLHLFGRRSLQPIFSAKN